MRCANAQQVAGLPVRVVDQRDLRRISGLRDRRILIQRHRQRGCDLAAAVGAQIQRGPRSLPVQAAGGPAPVVYVHGSSGHVLLGQNSGEGEVQPVQHLRVRAGEAVLAGDRRAVLRHGDGVEFQRGSGLTAVEPALQILLHLRVGDVGGLAVVGEIRPTLPARIGIAEFDLFVPVGVFFLLVVIGVLHSIRQRVAVFDIGGRVVHTGKIIDLHLTVGGDGHRPADSVFAALRHLHKGVAVLYIERAISLSYQFGKSALIA